MPARLTGHPPSVQPQTHVYGALNLVERQALEDFRAAIRRRLELARDIGPKSDAARGLHARALRLAIKREAEARRALEELLAEGE